MCSNLKNICLFLLMNVPLFLFSQEKIHAQKIWDKGGHNAFTDLIRFQDKFYCTFREGENHVHGEDGKIRVLVSDDGDVWTSLALIEKSGYDLRDSKLSITPKGRLMLLMGGSKYENKTLLGRLTHVSFFDPNRKQFSAPQAVRIDEKIKSNWDWLWRVTWHKGKGYGVVYRKENNLGSQAFLVSTKDGVRYDLVYALDVFGLPGEASVAFKGDEMYMVIRRDYKEVNGLLGISKMPYSTWTWKDLGVHLGGPQIMFSSEGKLLLGSRSFHREGENNHDKTSIFMINKSFEIEKEIVLHSGGDNSYPGMVEHNGVLWVSYYSSHEGKSNVYMAKIPLNDLGLK